MRRVDACAGSVLARRATGVGFVRVTVPRGVWCEDRCESLAIFSNYDEFCCCRPFTHAHTSPLMYSDRSAESYLLCDNVICVFGQI